MAFGQSSGPPATGRQLRELLELLEEAGHSDYRDARGPMGFTQRQAAGKFTGPEADEFIEQLQTEIHGNEPPPGSRPAAHAPSDESDTQEPNTGHRRTAKIPATDATGDGADVVGGLGDVPVEALAAELQRRGWIVIEP